MTRHRPTTDARQTVTATCGAATVTITVDYSAAPPRITSHTVIGRRWTCYEEMFPEPGAYLTRGTFPWVRSHRRMPPTAGWLVHSMGGAIDVNGKDGDDYLIASHEAREQAAKRWRVYRRRGKQIAAMQRAVRASLEAGEVAK